MLLWVVVSYGLIGRYCSFGGTYRLHLELLERRKHRHFYSRDELKSQVEELNAFIPEMAKPALRT
jgi:hypothetical protein